MRDKVIGAGFQLMRMTGLDRLMAGVTRGLGAILMFHHVRPAGDADSGFAPNRLLEITPAFFDQVLAALARQGFDVISMDAALARLRNGADRHVRPFAVLTFDDGYRDTRDFALPIMRRYGVPFTVYVTSGFAQRTARMWWKELELAVGAAASIELDMEGHLLRLKCESESEKYRSFNILYQHLRAGPEERLLSVIAGLCARHRVDGGAVVERLCMDFDEIKRLAQDPLCTIGAHTCSHAMLAKHDADVARRELVDSKRRIEAAVGRRAAHLAYPVGDPISAGEREFAMARDAGYATAVTTRPGMLFGEHAAHLTALPRLSINGLWQDIRHVESLLSGVPFALWNRGRRLNVV